MTLTCLDVFNHFLGYILIIGFEQLLSIKETIEFGGNMYRHLLTYF